MKSYAFSAAIAAAVVCISPQAAFADEFYAVTPSGRTEGFYDMPLRQAAAHLTSACIDLGWNVISSTDTIVTCEAPMNFGQQLLSNLLVGNQYSTPPKRYYRFNLAGLDRTTRVQVSGWIETQMAFGQIRQEPLEGPAFHNDVMRFIENTKGRWPAGTSFPNHVYMGVGFQEVERPEKGLSVETVEPGAAGAAAGLMPGDVIIRIARERVKAVGDIFDALAKAAKSPSFDVELYRAGKKTTLTAGRMFRSPIGQPELAAFPDDVPQAPVINNIAAPSVADELAKLAKLRDDGIISEKEFAVQKDKLLTN